MANSSDTAVIVRCPPESRDRLLRTVPGGRATISMPLSSTSSLSTRLRSAAPPPKILSKVKAKFFLICSKVSENSFCEVALISSMSAIRAFFEAQRSSVWDLRKS